MDKDKIKKNLNATNNVFGYFPLVTILITTIHSFSLRICLGRWPKIYVDDPRNIFLIILDKISTYVLLAGIVIIPLYLIINIIMIFMSKSKKSFLKNIIICMSGAIILMLLIKFDPAGYFNWFFD
jgi:hypothetical protein